MSSIHLHIGPEKTGTKTIQSFLKANSGNLNKQSIYIPEFLGWAHRKITCLAFNKESKDDFFITEGALSEECKELKITECRNEFNHHASGLKNYNWVVSCEFMQSRLQHTKELQTLKDTLEKHFSKINIILYIRKQIDAAVSLWSTAVQSGMPWTELPSPSDVSYAFNHKNTIERWKSVFGEAITVRIFDKNEFIDGSLIKDFCFASSIEWDESFVTPDAENESMSSLAIQALSKINKGLPYIIDGAINKNRSNIADLIKQHFILYPKFTPNPGQVASYFDYYQESNEWVRAKYFKNKANLFSKNIVFCTQKEAVITLDNVLDIYGDLVVKILQSKSI